jgi:hypothetical protein
MNPRASRASRTHGHQHGVEGELAVDGRTRRPTDDLAREEIHHHDQVQPALPRPHVGDIRDPDASVDGWKLIQARRSSRRYSSGGVASTRQRNVIRWAALPCVLVVIVWLASDAIASYRNWQQTTVSDPSAAEAYETDFWVDVVAVAVTAGIGLAMFVGLRAKTDTDSRR